MEELQSIKSMIFEIREYQVMIDADLAKIYQVETKRLNEAVKRNIDRFPPEFMFQLTEEEYEFLRPQIFAICLYRTWRYIARPIREKLDDLEKILMLHIDDTNHNFTNYSPP